MSARWLKPRHDNAFSSGPCGMPQNVSSYCASAACKAAKASAVSPASVKAAARSRTSPCRAATVPTRHSKSAQYDDPQAAQQPCSFMFHNL